MCVVGGGGDERDCDLGVEERREEARKGGLAVVAKQMMGVSKQRRDKNDEKTEAETGKGRYSESEGRERVFVADRFIC